jgi:hypothetical protein
MTNKGYWSGLAWAGILAVAGSGPLAKADVVTFSGLNGGDNSAFTTYTEGNYTITPISGSWFQDDTAFGNPIPSIYDGPVGTPGDATIEITSSAGPFTYQSVDYSSNNGDSEINARGSLNNVGVFSTTEPAPGPGSAFTTLASPDSSDPIDRLFLEVLPGAGGATSINLDNIVLNPAVSASPEPGTMILLGVGLLGLAQYRRSRRAV